MTPTWDELQARGAVLDGIDIVVTDVFDPANPEDDHWFGRLTNAIHIRTRKSVVERDLLFKAGDPVDAGLIRETERRLRAHPFVRSASIVATAAPGSAVRARVVVHDAWSLLIEAGIRHSGGNTTSHVRLDEVNLVGLGKHLIASYRKDPERTTSEIGYFDPQLLGSRWVLLASYATLQDGKSRRFSIGLPHYSTASRYSFGVNLSASESTLTIYNRGERVFAYPGRHDAADVFASLAYKVRDRAAFRVGLSLRSRGDDYGNGAIYRSDWLPVPDTSPLRLRGWMASWSVLQERYASFQNLAGISHTEDYNLGWTLAGGAGYYARSFGSTISAPFGEAVVTKGWRIGPETLGFLNAAWSGRREADGWRDAVTRGTLTLYNTSLPSQTLAARLAMAAVVRPDPAGTIYLDAAGGMRGYVDHFLAGDRRLVFSAEDRVITNWRLFGLAQVGFVGYLDVGAVRRLDTGGWSRTYANVGGGLRLGILKSARGNVFQVTVAIPLARDAGFARAALVVGNTVSF